MRRWALAALVLLVSIIVITSLILSAVHLLNDADAHLELGIIRINIDGRFARLSADAEISPGPEPDSTDLVLRFDDSEIPVDYDGETLSAELTEKDLRTLLDRDYVDIAGSAKIPFGPLKIGGDVSKRVNVSFIHELATSLNVSNVNVTFTFTGNTIVDFDIDSDIERDFILQVNNTPARLSSPGGGSFDCTILDLHYRTGQVGKARVSIPALGALGLALYARNITVDIWGIQAEIPIPLFNG
ncbi:MAG TPA: hypothetical protein ENK47_01745 [Euryarchaeota archaeon]|nr:MAG: hypothetical protein B6U90_04840 [Thermoplasmatales archaeon ex4484_6]HHD15410.1 hypothetical protein [Euryarchaeota archaeon]